MRTKSCTYTKCPIPVIRQTKEQCENFVAGFRSIIGLKSLSYFNTHELQYLISGHTSDIDLEDLRKNAQYYGGFHVLKKGIFFEIRYILFTGPLLGFAFLEPPFSIRCVETSDDMDQGDTLGSVIRGFLAIKRNNQ
uniref:HECT-type E3 ubiquitin transferase n=1 Tax=Ditylenchus dipsaci TaxID=166011 RepID=A0A915DW13_9BILA